MSRRIEEAGSAILPGALGIALLLLAFLGAGNLVLDEYAKGALRNAVDQGAQVGAAAGGSVSACQEAAGEAKIGLLPGGYGAGTQIVCTLQGDEVVAFASAHLPSLVPEVPAASVSVQGVSITDNGGLP